MILTKLFDGNVNTSTPLGGLNLSSFSHYSVLLRIDNAASNTQPFRFTTYNNNIQVYQHDFSTTNGWHTHNIVHDIFHPNVSFVMYVWNNSALIRLWIYATCCNPNEKKKEAQHLEVKGIKFTELGIVEFT
ncbi:MAG TPA: hypothetical protein VH796_00255 [Nitrososphaeraceae archaeon]|jgi:hypothetical protein